MLDYDNDHSKIYKTVTTATYMLKKANFFSFFYAGRRKKRARAGEILGTWCETVGRQTPIFFLSKKTVGTL